MGGADTKLEMMGIIKKDNMQGGPKTLMNMDGGGGIVVGREPKTKVSQNQIQDLLKKMFHNDDGSKFGNSEFGDVSKWDQASQMDRTYSALTDNNQDRGKQFVENYQIIEPISIGAHSTIWKIRSRLTQQNFILKMIKKFKYGRHWRKVLPAFSKYKKIDHSNQSKMHAFFHDKQNFYIV